MMTSRAPVGLQYIVGLLTFVVIDSLQTDGDQREYIRTVNSFRVNSQRIKLSARLKSNDFVCGRLK